MENKIEVLCHSSIRITGGKTIYVDPFKIDKNYNDADYIFCTHSHYDHFSEEDIRKVMKDDTVIITVESSKENALEIFENESRVILVIPNNEYEVKGLKFRTTLAYNINKEFHPKQNNWVGYILELNNQKIYIAGDTDNIQELRNIKCDVAMLPIGGTYTMTYKEAAELANVIDAKVIIPIHYGCIVGEKEDAEKFKKLVKGKKVKILI